MFMKIPERIKFNGGKKATTGLRMEFMLDAIRTLEVHPQQGSVQLAQGLRRRFNQTNEEVKTRVYDQLEHGLDPEAANYDDLEDTFEDLFVLLVLSSKYFFPIPHDQYPNKSLHSTACAPDWDFMRWVRKHTIARIQT